MGRPRLYHTPEEQQQANREKSKRHYNKAKKTIRVRQSIKYREGVQRSLRVLPLACMRGQVEGQTNGDRSSQNPDHINYWCKRAETVASTFQTLMGKSPFHFVDTLYTRYLINQNNDTFRDAIITIARLQKNIRHYQDGILQLNGVGKEWTRCEEIAKGISDVLKALEDMLCYAMAGVEDLVSCHSCRELVYQMLPSM